MQPLTHAALWQLGTGRTLIGSLAVIGGAVPGMLGGRKSGPLLYEVHTASFDGGPYTLHQLRHTRLTHAAEEGASSLRSVRYQSPSHSSESAATSAVSP
ncbi:hypothetical protein [Nocardia asteroides]|uniref:hypothetical protein n=1 Tax=Nocardia asteroides TaxID=1824 RepID=UPI001E4EBE63|nr:hypothetical protein [Nocardia asteroides]UGT62673.1 hypothetical protein LTT61_04815 [Nocardia asteroides]